MTNEAKYHLQLASCVEVFEFDIPTQTFTSRNRLWEYSAQSISQLKRIVNKNRYPLDEFRNINGYIRNGKYHEN